jgi:hypothetical protein
MDLSRAPLTFVGSDEYWSFKKQWIGGLRY